MYDIWINVGTRTVAVHAPSLEVARIVWDALKMHYDMKSTRP